MSEVIFNYNGLKTKIKCNLDDKMKNICQAYLNTINESRNNISFSYKGKSGNSFNEELKFSEMIDSEDKSTKKLNIFVFKNNTKFNGNNIIKPTIVCPFCGESIRFEIINYKIKFSQCKNGHKIDNILLREYIYLNKNKIKCDICHNNNNNINFYKCILCKKNMCSSCTSNHDKTHRIINYNEILYICGKHYQFYDSYCEDCKINLCSLCQAEHNKSHKKIDFKYIIPNKSELSEYRKYLNNLGNNIKLFNNNVQIIINSLKKVANNMKIYYKINEDIINNFDYKKINYETLYNLKQIKEKSIINELENIINESSIKKKFNDIFDIYSKMNINEINIIYKVDKKKKEKEVRLFNNDFIEKNLNYCRMIIDGKEEYLKENITLPDDKIIDKFQIKLKGIINITDISSMFRWCKSLESIPDIAKWDTSNVTNMNGMFYKCESLTSLPDISKWNISYVNDISYMFYRCNSLKSLPDISNWDTSNVNNMSFLFYGCSSLESLPDISKWHTNNVTNMSYMFYECQSLQFLPDISRWNTFNVNSMGEIFYGCSSLQSLPELSKWNTKNVTDMSYMLYECKSLNALPDISNWDTKNVTNMRQMFYGCFSLLSLPDFSKWNLANVQEMTWIFEGCNENINIPLIFQDKNSLYHLTYNK